MERADGKNRSVDRLLAWMLIVSALAATVGIAIFLWSSIGAGSLHIGLQIAFGAGSIFAGAYMLNWLKARYW